MILKSKKKMRTSLLFYTFTLLTCLVLSSCGENSTSKGTLAKDSLLKDSINTLLVEDFILAEIENEPFSDTKAKNLLKFAPQELAGEISKGKWDVIESNPNKISIIIGLFGEDYKNVLKNRNPLRIYQEIMTYAKTKFELMKQILRVKKQYKTRKFSKILAKLEKVLEKNDFEAFHKILEDLHKKSKQPKSEIHFLRAEEYRARKKYKEAEKQYKLATEIDTSNPLYESKYGNVLFSTKKFDAAIIHHKKAWLMNKVSPKAFDNTEMADDLNSMGLDYSGLKKYKEAIEHFEESIEVKKSLYGEEHPSIAEGYANIGLIYIHLKQLNLALNYYDKALKIEKKVYGETHPKVALRYYNKAVVYRLKKRLDSSLLFLEKTLDIYLKNFGKTDLKVGAIYKVIGNTYLNLNKPELGKMYIEKGKAIDRKHFGQFQE